MKKVLLILFCVVSLTATASLGRNAPLANENKSGLYAKSIEHILLLDERDVDLATAVLIISEQWNDNVNGKYYILQLDDMALEIRSRLQAKKIPLNHRAIPIINDYLFDELKFNSVEKADNPDDLFLHSVIDNKQGYCLSLSILYLSIAERLGMPLYGVVVPGHFFVRYDDGNRHFNIETTGKGGTASDEHYIEKFKVPEGDSDSIYLSNLDKVQTLGCFFNNLGNSYTDVGNNEQALIALERAVEINPSLAESHTNLGNVYMKYKQLEDAMYQYQLALRINPNNAISHHNMANAYQERGWFNNAVDEYSQALELDPDFTDTYFSLAVAYAKKEMFKRAISYLREAIVLEPKNSKCYNHLGDVYRQAEDYDKSIKNYKKVLKIKPKSAGAHFGMALCYNKMGQTKKEIAEYKKALDIEPDMPAALTNLGNAYFIKKKYDKALSQYKKAARISPDDNLIHYNIAACYFNNSDYKNAAIHYKKATELDYTMAEAHNSLANAYFKLKKFKLALEHIELAEQLGAEINKKLLKAIKDKL